MQHKTTLILILVCLVCGDKIVAQQVESIKSELESKARDHLRAGDYEAAARQMEHLIKVFAKVENYHLVLADARFMNGQMKEAIAAYDRAIELNSRLAPRCWQRGLALYYADEFEKGKQQFETHQTVNRQDVENSVWHFLCHARIAGVQKAREDMIPIQGDQRVPMPEVFELFAGNGTIEQVIKAAEEAGGASERIRNGHLYYAYIYVGLYHEMMGDPEKANEAMKKASDINPVSKAQLMGSIADVHLKLRDPKNRN